MLLPALVLNAILLLRISGSHRAGGIFVWTEREVTRQNRAIVTLHSHLFNADIVTAAAASQCDAVCGCHSCRRSVALLSLLIEQLQF